MSFLDTIFNPVILPLLKLPAWLSIMIIALVISILITLIYKWMTDQHLMKSLKDDIKKYQQEMKKHRQDPKKFMDIQKKAMEVNMKYMKHSLKPTLVTFLPIIIIFAYLNSHMAFDNINPAEEFTASLYFVEGTTGNVTLNVSDKIVLTSPAIKQIEDGKASWRLKASESGMYELRFSFKDESYKKDVKITSIKGDYEQPVMLIQNSKLTTIEIGNKEIKPFGESFNIFGWYPGWIAAYIFYSLIFSLGLRKVLNLY